MSTVLGKLKKKSIFTAAILGLSCTSVMAADINLSQIELKSAQNGGYDIILNTDKKAEFKQTLKGENQLVIELKNTAATEDLSTLYNDVSTINNITVLPAGKDDLRIQIQGSEVQNTNVKLNYQSVQTPVVSQNFDPSQINLSLPMENYKPVYEETELEEEVTTGASTLLSKLNPTNIAQKFSAEADETSSEPKSSMNWLTYAGLALILITAAKNIFKPADEAQIGLSQTLKEREKAIANKLNAGVRETLSQRNKMAQNASAPSINYAVRSYQNSQKNPYETAQPALRPVRKPASAAYSQPPTTPVRKTVTTPISTATVAPKYTQREAVATVPRTQSTNVDSMKFLESMTKIYEKNGRNDLAIGLKNNMKKVNI